MPERLLRPHLGPEFSFSRHTIFSFVWHTLCIDNQWYFSLDPAERWRDPRMGCKAHFLGEKLLPAQKCTNVCDQFAGVCMDKAWCDWHNLAHSLEFAVTFARILGDTKWASVVSTLQGPWSQCWLQCATTLKETLSSSVQRKYISKASSSHL